MNDCSWKSVLPIIPFRVVKINKHITHRWVSLSISAEAITCGNIPKTLDICLNKSQMPDCALKCYKTGAITGSNDCMVHIRHQAITWTNADLYFKRPLLRNCMCEINIQTFLSLKSFWKSHAKCHHSSSNWWVAVLQHVWSFPHPPSISVGTNYKKRHYRPDMCLISLDLQNNKQLKRKEINRPQKENN